jgi:predicted AAA+ superfamily ATPase
MEAILAGVPDGTKPYFYRSATGHEVDLVLELSASRRWAFEFKKSLSPGVEKGFHIACADIAAARRILVYPGQDAYPGTGGTEVMPLLDAVKAVRDINAKPLKR